MIMKDIILELIKTMKVYNYNKYKLDSTCNNNEYSDNNNSSNI